MELKEPQKEPNQLSGKGVNDSITLCIVRHGESIHNVAERYGVDTRSDLKYYDPPLTEKGCLDVSEELRPTCNLTGVFSVWVSPLRRTLETAVIALPELSEFVVVETLREIAGLKTADARRRKSEIEAWLKTRFPDKRFDLTLVSGETDPYEGGTVRETAADIIERIIASLQLLLESGQKNVIWVSHSAFLSCLMSYLFLPSGNPEARWLRNGEWRIIDLPVKALKRHLERWPSTITQGNRTWQFVPGSHWGTRALLVEPLPAPLLTTDLLNSLSELVNIATFPPKTQIYAVESIAALVFGARLRERSPHKHVVVLGHPFRPKNEPDTATTIAATTIPATTVAATTIAVVPQNDLLVQSSPVQSSPVQSSPVQSSPSLARTSSGALINGDPVLLSACNQVVAHLRTDCDISLQVEDPPDKIHGEGLLVHHEHSPLANRVPEHVLGEKAKPWIYKTEGYSRISLTSANTIHSTKLGVQTRAHLLVICHPSSQQETGKPENGVPCHQSTRVCERAPFWCTAGYLRCLAQDISLLPDSLCPLSITIIMPFSL
ncbi:histidine phosphatase superfamily (branch 1) protein [Gregarina niphandrodes]|uniref:Histidine phosphatase superfamily (Branch 1) protein n=1 Tax=Gregarina niphandrodes TaxID=110365 RepID=A0A023B8Z3_GRENI|nr:histidine phosphatase superfamily (branch 1) protein [Gregarina niphandrodes]EZG70664.1 histidine phosphatase superfamily (branch 1) protein [Gregarina niphandrodes]|eukprot:XP_011129905.1 histidine phosphatase superfamily (branch 1) protein [Gregarina niphandrodes]